MVEAIVATGKDRARLARFVERATMLGYPRDRIEPDFQAYFTSTLQGVENPPAYVAKMTPTGRGRLDAVNGIANAVFANALAMPSNGKVADAPVNYPYLWDIWRFDWVQYNASARHPMGRNIVETMGTGQLQIVDPKTGELYPEPRRWQTNARIHNIHALRSSFTRCNRRHGQRPCSATSTEHVLPRVASCSARTAPAVMASRPSQQPPIRSNGTCLSSR